MNDDYAETVNEGRAVRRQARALRARALRHPDPRDPDALEEEDWGTLAELEDRTP